VHELALFYHAAPLNIVEHYFLSLLWPMIDCTAILRGNILRRDQSLGNSVRLYKKTITASKENDVILPTEREKSRRIIQPRSRTIH